ncbi:hypothetical protein AB1L88_03245 [Tautonia sp. JC769]|uniref:hypothetical protein n=1 Tax=Tautonia sp. JC769 TaxID=3232135 RepID=UPI00345A7947
MRHLADPDFGNPFEAPSAPSRGRGSDRDGSDTRSRRFFRSRELALLAGLHPVLVAGGVYGSWLLAWRMLGHPPRPSLDDPLGIAPSVSLLYWVTVVIIATSPAALIASATAWVVMLWGEVLHGQRRVLRVLLPPLAWIAAIKVSRHDPGRVFEWFID